MSTPNVIIVSGISSTTSLVGGTGYTNGTYQLGIVVMAGVLVHILLLAM
jgi:hypothetical protein